MVRFFDNDHVRYRGGTHFGAVVGVEDRGLRTEMDDAEMGRRAVIL